jgi:peptide/nickel transport system permease protein
MTDDTDDPVADGGVTGRTDTFETVDWSEIELGQDRSLTGILWLVAVGIWSLLAINDIHSRYMTDAGAVSYPVLGRIQPVDWLWALTLAVLLYYGVRPLAKHPRMTKYYWKEFRKNKAAVISGIFLMVILFVGLVGARVIPKPEPTPGLQHQPPFWMSAQSWLTGPQCPGGRTNGGAWCQGSMEHPLGTTGQGEDIFGIVIHGMEVSMQVGLISMLITISIATLVGLTAAFYGGLIDEVLMRFVDLMQSIPALFLYLLIAYAIGGSLFLIVAILGFISWPFAARLLRAEALQRREEPFMTAAKSAGASPYWTIRRHLVPNISSTMITAATLAIPGFILAEAILAFLGLADPAIPSWGRLIAQGRADLDNAWWVSTLPGIFLFLVILAFNFMGDALRDALDPRQGGSGE